MGQNWYQFEDTFLATSSIFKHLLGCNCWEDGKLHFFGNKFCSIREMIHLITMNLIHAKYQKKTFYSHYHLQPQFTQPFNGSNNSVSSGAIKVIELCSVSNYVLLFWTLYYREIYIYPESMKVRIILIYIHLI